MSRQLFNSNITNLGAPPIPLVQRAARAYDKSLGPLIDLSQAVPDYPPPAFLLDALSTKAGDPAWLGYGDIEGEPVLRAAYARDLENTHGSRLTADNVMITAGCNQAFVAAVLSIAAPGESVMLIEPLYFNHQSTLSMLGIHTTHASVDASTGFLPDPAKLEAFLTPDVRALAIVSPNNPTGAAYPPELLHELFQLCVRRGIWMILDETYQDFLPDGHGRAHSLFNENFEEHLIVLSSFSKSYCIPGHRLGAAVAGSAILQQMVKVMDNLQICAPRAAQAALAKCMPELVAWREGNREEINRRAATLVTAMDSLPGWRIDAMGAYFAYVQHPWADTPSFDVAERLARELGVVTLPGEFFGAGQERYLRVAFANVVSDVIALLPERLAD